jgi:hypothetical protein
MSPSRQSALKQADTLRHPSACQPMKLQSLPVSWNHQAVCRLIAPVCMWTAFKEASNLLCHSLNISHCCQWKRRIEIEGTFEQLWLLIRSGRKWARHPTWRRQDQRSQSNREYRNVQADEWLSSPQTWACSRNEGPRPPGYPVWYFQKTAGPVLKHERVMSPPLILI